jgi:hypothetical protein
MMSTQVKFGLIVGTVGLLVNICVSTLLGICGPVMALLAGGIAGLLTAQAEQAATRSDGARSGSYSWGYRRRAGVHRTIDRRLGGAGFDSGHRHATFFRRTTIGFGYSRAVWLLAGGDRGWNVLWGL